MYARSTTLNGMPENVDEGIRFIEGEVRPLTETIDGCMGLSMLVDRESGMCIATTSWETEESMRASNERLGPVRDRGREILGGTMQVDEWEIGVMHRTDHGSCCRVTWLRGEVGALTGVFRDVAMPAMEQVPGFCSASVLLNRGTGKACVTMTYDTRESLTASRPMADQIRARASAESGMEVVDVREFDITYAHLHVPELV